MSIMKNGIKKLIGGLAAALLLLTFSSAAYAVATTVSCNGTNSPANQIYNSTGVGGTLLAAGKYVQIIQSDDATAGTPSASNGLPSGDTVIATGTLSAAGNFSGTCNINASKYVYIRAWETWTGSGAPTGNWGTSTPANVGTGFAFTYKPASFATTSAFLPVIGVNPTAIPFSATQGNNPSPNTATVTLTNSGSLALTSWTAGTINYTGGQSGWATPSKTSGGPIAPGANDTFTVTIGNVSAFTAGTYTATIPLSFSQGLAAQNVVVTLTINNQGSPSITVNPTAVPFSANTGSNPSPNNATVTLSNTGSVALTSWNAGTINYAGGQTGWATPSKTSGGPIAAAGSDSFTVTIGNVSAFSAGTYTATIPLTFSQSVAAQNVVVTLTIGGGGNNPTIGTFAPTSAYVGQTVVITGTKFGATKGTSTITIGGVTANPTAWGDTSITVAVPSGASGTKVVVTTSSGSGEGTLTIKTGGAVIDDVEGGSVGKWTAGLVQSGYFVFDNSLDITPDKANIATQLPQAEAKHHGALGAKVKYSFNGTDGTSWGGGWGAQLANTLDLSSYNKLSFAVKWDGSTNAFKLSLQDSDGTATAATITNATLTAFNAAYGVIDIQKTSFAYDAGGSKANADATFDWTKVAGYSIVYNTQGTSSSYHFIDCVTAGDVNFPDDPNPPVTGEVTITSVQPPTGPAGSHVIINGTSFGTAQGQSQLVFTSNSQTDSTTYAMTVVSWSDTSIEAIVPRLAPAGSYTLKVVKMAITQGVLQALESNPEGFQVTAPVPPGGGAIVFPNPFNPLATGLTTNGLAANSVYIAYDVSTTTNIGIYIYDMTGRQVYHNTTTSGQVSWNGRDADGNIVADGLYLLRIVNEDTKSLISKGRILVIKK